MVNILINASQAIEKKMGAIVIRTAHREKEKENLLRISDDGKGIDEKTMKQIFDPFFTTKRNQGGTGLGLSIAYGIIKEHKGRIEVESKPGPAPRSRYTSRRAKGEAHEENPGHRRRSGGPELPEHHAAADRRLRDRHAGQQPKAFHELKANNYDLLLLDMDMPDVSGLDILKHIKEKNIDIETIVLTGVEDVELAVSAMKLGAFDYLTKPVDNDQLLKVITTVLENRKAPRAAPRRKPRCPASSLKFKDAFKDIITQNADMIRMFQMVEKMAQPDNSILIWGESGTGKELIAKAIHRISRRRDENFVAVNAGTFANELFSSEFFGHDKGAFTGASAAKKGFLEEADKGTLFLDEIGELALPDPGEAAARSAGRGIFPAGIDQEPESGRAHHRRHQQGPAERDEKGQFPQGPFLPPEHELGLPPAAARKKRGYSAPVPAFPGEIQRAEPEKHPENFGRRPCAC